MSDSRLPVASTSTLSTNEVKPELPSSLAALTLRKLIALNLQSVGFDSTSEEALEELEGLVFTFFEVISKQAHDYAELGHRNGVPNFRDILSSCGVLGVGGIPELKEEVMMKYNLEDVDPSTFTITYSPPSSSLLPPPPLLPPLPSEPLPPILSHSFLASYLPPLPPSHTFSQTPVYPQSISTPLEIPASSLGQQGLTEEALNHLGVLRLRLSDSRLVAGSLRGLVRGIHLGGKGIGSTSTISGGGGGILGEVATTGVIEGEENDDIIDYESEWYGGIIGKGRKRQMGLVRVGNRLKEAGAGAGAGGEEEEVIEEEEKRIGGAGKRRKWRV